MKITVIGSSHGVPEPNRKCTSFLIEVGANLYFVDMGTPGIDALRKRGLSVDAVKGIFITHMHGDHTNGLIPFVDLITWYFKTADPEIYLPIVEAADNIKAWLKSTLTGERDIRFREVTPGVMFDDGILKVTSIPTQHCYKSNAYLIEAEGKAVLFTGDLKNPNVDWPVDALSAPLDLVISECAHFPASEYLPLYEREDIRKICITHYAPRFTDTVYALQKHLDELNKPMLIATDGLEIEV